MPNIPDITLTSIETITAMDILTGEFRYQLDELQNATLGQTEDTQDITGKNGVILNRLKRNKGVTLSGTNALISAGMLEVQTGSQFETESAANVLHPDFITVNDDTATTTYKAVGTAGDEIAYAYVRNADGSLGKKFTQDAAAAAGKFAYDPDTKTITFNADEVADGTEIAVYYFRGVAAEVLKNSADTFSEKVALYIDALGEDKCGKIYHVQIYMPKADMSGAFELAMGDSQTVHAFEAASMKGGCAAGAGDLWTYTVFDADAADA